MAESLIYYTLVATRRVLEAIPREKDLFEPFSRYENMSPDEIKGILDETRRKNIIDRYIGTEEGPLSEEKFQNAFLDNFIEQFVEYRERSELMGKKENVLLPDKNGKFAEDQYYQEMAWELGSKLEKEYLENLINLRSSVAPAARTEKLRSRLAENKLLLARGKSGKFDTFLSLDDISHALDNPTFARKLRATLAPTLETFNQIPRQSDLSPTAAALLPVVIKQGTQVSTSEFANLEAQILLKQALTERACLKANGFMVDGQMKIDMQTRVLSAEVIDREGKRLLMRLNMSAAERLFNFTFLELEGDEKKRREMALTARELANFHKQNLTAREIYNQKRGAHGAEQPPAELAPVIKSEGAAVIPVESALAELAVEQAVEAGHKGGLAEGLESAALAALPDEIILQRKRKVRPQVLHRQPVMTAAPVTRQVVPKGPLKGASAGGIQSAKQAVAARRARSERQKEIMEGGYEELEAQTPKPAQLPIIGLAAGEMPVEGVAAKPRQKGGAAGLVGKIFFGGAAAAGGVTTGLIGTGLI